MNYITRMYTRRPLEEGEIAGPEEEVVGDEIISPVDFTVTIDEQGAAVFAEIKRQEK